MIGNPTTEIYDSPSPAGGRGLGLILSPRGEEFRRCAVLKCMVSTFKKLVKEKNMTCFREGPLTPRSLSSTMSSIYRKYGNDYEKIPLDHDFFLLRHCIPVASVAFCHSTYGHPDHGGNEPVVRGFRPCLLGGDDQPSSFQDPLGVNR